MILHPFNESAVDISISALLSWKGNILEADYFLKGSLQNIVKLSDSPTSNHRRQGLWKTTCFEWFIKPVGSEFYWEANFSADGDWNIFKLDGYRRNLIEEAHISSVRTIVKNADIEWHLKTQVDFSALKLPKGSRFHAHLSAVIETVDEKKHYWSLKHSQKQPDFHHPDHFILEIQKES